MCPKEAPPYPKPLAASEADDPAPVTRRVETSWAKAIANAANEELDITFDAVDDPSDDPDERPTVGLQSHAGAPAGSLGRGEGADSSFTRRPAAPGSSAFDRATIAPPVPEREYVARMMLQVPESHPAPRVGTASAGLGGDDPDLASSKPTPVHGLSPLILDFSESLPPLAPEDASPAADIGELSLEFEPLEGDALGLAEVRATSSQPDPLPAASVRDIRDRFDVGDFSGALNLAETRLAYHPDDADASAYAQHCRDKLKQMYIARLGGLRRTPHVSSTPEQLRWLALDHRAGFLLSLVDGRSTLDEVLDMSGMAELDALRLLMQLMQQNVLKVV